MTNPPSAPAPATGRPRTTTIIALCGVTLVLAAGIVVTTLFALNDSGVITCGATQSVSLAECTDPVPPCSDQAVGCASPTDPLSPSADDGQSSQAVELSVGECVIWAAHQTPVPIDCADAVTGDFQIVDEVAHPSGCQDKDQPTIETPDGTAYCLMPYSD